MSKIMELADAYARLLSRVEYLQDQGTTNEMANIYPEVQCKCHEARAALIAEVEKLQATATHYAGMGRSS